MTPLQSSRSFGFQSTSLHRKKEPHAFHFIQKKTSFWIATLSIFAFIFGNMVGQHGWYTFWASVRGNVDDSLIVYSGTIPPVAKVPDYRQWYSYGGDPVQHTFKQVPRDLLIDLPPYNPHDTEPGGTQDIFYSVGYMGSYKTGHDGDGSHPGVDIRLPIGTPIVSIANGIVDEVKYDGGFGQVVTIRHPNVPDPDNPRTTTTLYSGYAHLSSVFVSVGQVVNKGDPIALSGDTGFASGPHLHFQIDNDEAPWHPYWPFTGSEMRAHGMDLVGAVNAGLHQSRGYSFTTHPMLYVQAHYPAATVIAQSEESSSSAVYISPLDRMLNRVAQRRAERATTQVVAVVESSSSASSVASQEPVEVVVETPPPTPVESVEVVATSTEEVTVAGGSTPVHAIEFSHDGSFSGRSWEKLRITLLDTDGNVAVNPNLTGDLHLRTAYGTAEFRPSVLSPLDFVNGMTEVNMLPRGNRTVVIKLVPFQSLSKPMQFSR